MWGVPTVWQALNHVGSTKLCGGAQNHVGHTDHVVSEQIQALRHFPFSLGERNCCLCLEKARACLAPIRKDS